MGIAPLEDPSYVPVHRPINGRPPAVVARWGKESQLRWFRRFWDELGPLLREEDLARFYCHSREHRGVCCSSCMSERDFDYYCTDACCCRAS